MTFALMTCAVARFLVIGEVHQQVSFSNERTGLERIPQRELNCARAAVDASDLTKVRVGHTKVRLLVGSDVKGIEEVTTKFEALFAIDRKSFFNRHIDVLETGPGKRGWANVAKVIGRLRGKDAVPIVCIRSTSGTLQISSEKGF